MIFKPDLAKLVKAGRVTMTSLPVREGEVRCRYKPERAYTVQPGRQERSIGQITVLSVKQHKLGDISLREARKHGFRTTADFWIHWDDNIYDPEEPIWTLTFVLGDQTDTPRLLAATLGAEGDYTTVRSRAMRGEPEAVSDAFLACFAAKADEKRSDLLVERKRGLQADLRALRAKGASNRELRALQRRHGKGPAYVC